MQGVHFPIDQQHIKERAYGIWERNGRPKDSAICDWFAAKRELTQELIERLEGKQTLLRMEDDGPAVYGLVPLAGKAKARVRCGLVELAGARSARGNGVRYGLVELEDNAPHRVRYGLVELDDGGASDRLRYGLVELSG